MRVPRARATEPLSGESSPATIRRSVDLPVPFGPMSPARSPLVSRKLTSLNRTRSAKRRPAAWTESTLMASRARAADAGSADSGTCSGRR